MNTPIVVGDFRKNARERVRVALDFHQGNNLVDIRVTTQLAEGTSVWIPTKKGFSVNIALLPLLLAALVDAETKARELGLIGGDG
jgi:hypothetical protein